MDLGNDLPIVREGAYVRPHFEGWPAKASYGQYEDKEMSVDPIAETSGHFRILIDAGGKDLLEYQVANRNPLSDEERSHFVDVPDIADLESHL